MISTNATPISINFVFLMMIFFGTVFLSVNIVERYAIDRIQTKGRIEYRLTFALFYFIAGVGSFSLILLLQIFSTSNTYGILEI